MKPKYKIYREGTFSVRLDPKNHCGGDLQPKFNYQCWIETEDLDPQGFVIDNFEIDKCFQEWGWGTWIASCEALAAGALDIIHTLLNGRALSIICKIIPNSFANIEIAWKKGQNLPTVLPVRIK